MAEDKQNENAVIAYTSLCQMLDEEGWTYDKHDDEMTIDLTVTGDDLPMSSTIEIDTERQTVIMMSPMPFKVPSDKRFDLAIAVSLANYGMVDGSFDYNFLEGDIAFRITSSFIDSMLGKDLFKYMTYTAFSTIDKYNDKFLKIAATKMSVAEIIEFMKE